MAESSDARDADLDDLTLLARERGRLSPGSEAMGGRVLQ